MRILTVIPTRYEEPRLRALLPFVDGDVLLLDNGHEPPLLGAEDARGLGVYAMWNRGWRRAAAARYDVLCLLNDDARILPGTVAMLAAALSDRRIGVTYPDWPTPLSAGLPDEIVTRDTKGTVSTGGMTGFCFAFRVTLPVGPFDEGYGWWYGDDAFEASVRDAGYRVARVVGLPCEHESDSERDNWARRPELAAIVEKDRAKWEST